MRKKLTAILFTTMLLGSMLLTGCGSTTSESSATSDTQQASEVTSTTEETTTEETATPEVVLPTVSTVNYSVLFDENDALIQYVPFAPVTSSYAELMMQVTGYTYTFTPVDATNYELDVVYECGQPGEDTAMYMKRSYKFTGTYTVEGDIYTIEAPQHLQFAQETAGQFAASSGEGAADFWGPNGLTYDETWTNPDGYQGATAGPDIMAAVSPCQIQINGTEIVSFISTVVPAPADAAATDATATDATATDATATDATATDTTATDATGN